MAHQVVAIAADGVSPLDLGAVAEIFGIDRRLGVPWYQLTVCSPEPGPVTTRGGLSVQVADDLSSVDEAETVIVLPVEYYIHGPVATAITDSLRGAHQRGARIVSLCVGAFALAASGLLDGTQATTHWRFCGQLAREHPSIDVQPDALYVDCGQVLTSGGIAAGIDLCLHVVRTDHGVEAANTLSRRLVTGPHRAGGQAQYIERPVPDHVPGPIGEAMGWALAHLHRPLTIADLAAHAHVSSRTFSRRFTEMTGTSPHQWIIGQRVERARHLLEMSDLAVTDVARQTGFRTAQSLRQHFVKRLGVSPSLYRRSYSGRAMPSG